jgi:hypothetical protein
MRQIPKIPNLNIASDQVAVEIVERAIHGIAFNYHDGLGRSGQWSDGMAEGAKYATELTLASLRRLGMLDIEIDPIAFSREVRSSIPE